ncbi:MAG TPA: hypothetical protein VMV86_06295 [Methanosarcinales archaeon]|nr:hypothetical protein [Methanosarcinales archaeon]
MVIVQLDGIRFKVEAPDIDQDGQSGGIETVTQRTSDGISQVVNTSELGDTLKELNLDTMDNASRMSAIDMRSNLHPFEINSVLAVDALVALGFLQTKCLSFTRQKKRLAVSLGGRGRDDIVNIVQGKREHDKASPSLWERAKSAWS